MKKKPKYNYAFDMAMSIESTSPFEDIPLADKIAAARKRLNDIEAENNEEALEVYCEYTVES